MRNRGAVLLVVLGLLALLAALAAAFASACAVERSTARNHLDAARARVLAQSGVETALARLRELAARGALFDGSAWSPCGHPGCCAEGCADAVGPGRLRIRIEDANARIHLNDGALEGPDHATSRNLRRLLNVLGAQPTVNVPRLGDRALAARPRGGFASVFDLLAALDHDREAFARVRPFVTARAWSDPDVANPAPFSEETAGEPFHPVRYDRPALAGGPVYRAGHGRNARGEPIRRPLLFFDRANPAPDHHAVWGRDSLNPRWIEVVSRSPVNVNAARREVLVALLTDLEGVFLVERRRAPLLAGLSACGSPGGGYGWTALRHGYDGDADEGDECGLLYRTRPFVGPGGRSGEGVSAGKIADEILACRERRLSPHVAGRDYAAEPYGGPFRSWTQFHRFADSLVEGGLLAETRVDDYWDADERGRPVPGAPEQIRTASRAIADVLKANFDPNLHLNELNPDRNLRLLVDKTDLLVNSTEFCLGPLGLFEVEAEGLVDGPAGDVVARHRVAAVLRVYDAVRQSTQAQFAAGEAGPRRAKSPETNNNRAIEVGPEPDNGPAPAEAGYEGYVRLATVGGDRTDGSSRARGELATTLSDPAFYPGAATSAPGGPHLGSAIHAHFALDHAAHDHAGRRGATKPAGWDGFRLPQGAWQSAVARRCCLQRNVEDPGEENPGPYGPVDAARPGGRGDYRLARSFRGAPPPAEGGAPSDLRIDGAYVERHSAFGYWLDESESFNFNEGAVAFWFKPAWDPAATGKRRTLLSAGRYHAMRPELLNPSPFGLFFVPPGPSSLPGGAPGALRPASLVFGLGLSPRTGYNRETSEASGPASLHAAAATPSLELGPLRAGAWTQLAVTWKLPRRRLPPPDALRIYVDGRALPGTESVPHLTADGEEGVPFETTPRWTTHSLQAAAGRAGALWVKNTIRLGGETSRLFDLPGDAGFFPGNFSADGTVDEFYLWLDRGPQFNGGLWGIQEHWKRGRYYVPDDRDPADARFTSVPVGLRRPPARRLDGEGAPPPPAPVRVLAVAWTCRPTEAPGPSVELDVHGDGARWGPFRDEGGSPVRDAGGEPPAVSELRWSAKFLRGAATAKPVLLESPALDDVTLFFDAGAPPIAGWVAVPEDLR
jgi:hypothetical protein